MIQFAELFKDCLSQFRETPEFGILNNVRAGHESLSAQERQSIIDGVERTFTPMFEQIRADASSLTDSDLVFCVLTGMGVGNTTIADCLTISPHTVRVRKHRLRDKLPASWYDVFYGDGNYEEPVNEVSHKSRLPFVREISNCFRNYFNTNGRASRLEYFSFYFFTVAVIYAFFHVQGVLYSLSYNASDRAVDGFVFVILHVITWIILLGVMAPMLTVTARRLHDLNCSGWLSLLLWGLPCAFVLFDSIYFLVYHGVLFGQIEVPAKFEEYVLTLVRFIFHFLNVMFFVQLLVFSIRGTKGANDYGADPLQ